MRKKTSTKSKEFIFFKTLIKRSKRIVLSTHTLPDGDGLGAETALFHYLKQAGKSCRVMNPDPLPPRYQLLDPKAEFLFSTERPLPWKTFDLWIIIDTNDSRRLGKIWNEFSTRAKNIVFLDHHADLIGIREDNYPSHATLVSDTKSSSIGELLYEVFDEVRLTKITPAIALGLYVSVMTDTNSFRYARTTALAHQIAGEMIQHGLNPEDIYQSIYSSKEISHIQLLGKILENVKTTADRKVAWLEMNREIRHQFKASADDTQSFLNLLLLLKDAEIICFFREEDSGKIRVSIKSKGRIVVNQLAMELGGGGHDYAAGVALSQPLKDSVQLIISRLSDLVRVTSRSNLTRTGKKLK